MIINTALLSRFQFAFTISFHILFPAFSIGLALFLAIMEGVWLKTKNVAYKEICQFWTKVFALTFGMGIVSGIVMEFQFGTNWSGFTRSIGGVLGSLFTYEVMTAFFIEAGFLGVMLFGWERVSRRLHYFATLLVTIGTTISAYWILDANTWMQHPIGYQANNGVFTVTNWVQVIFNPATPPRFIHMLLASYISTSFVIASISAFYLLKQQHLNFAKKCFSFIWIALLFLIPLQVYFGDEAGLEVFRNQPLKTAAIEGIWENQRGAPFVIFALPSNQHQRNFFELTIPHGAAIINTHHLNGEMIGLKSVSPQDQPRVWPVFFGFRIMVAIGVLMLLLAIIALFLRIKNNLYNSSWFLKISVISAPLGFIALWCGWITAEIGRQPWIVYQLIRTADAVSKVSLQDVIISFVLIIIVYGVIFGWFYFYFLHQMIKKGPSLIEETKLTDQPFQYMSASISKEPKK